MNAPELFDREETLRRLNEIDGDTCKELHLKIAEYIESAKSGRSIGGRFSPGDLALGLFFCFCIFADDAATYTDPIFENGHRYIDALVNDRELAAFEKKAFDDFHAECKPKKEHHTGPRTRKIRSSVATPTWMTARD